MSKRIFEQQIKEKKKNAAKCLDDLVKSRRLTAGRGRRVKAKIVVLLRMHEQQQERDRRAREKMRRQQQKYSRLLNYPGWNIAEVGMRGTMFSSEPVPLKQHECITWCKFVVKLYSTTDKRLSFHFGLYFDWDEVERDEEGIVIHRNLRAVAKYRSWRFCSGEQHDLIAAARDILLEKYPKLRAQAFRLDVDVQDVFCRAYPK